MKDVLYRNQNPHTFDVPSLCRDLGFKVVGSPKAHAFVSRAGSAVRDAWIRRYGVRPQTALTRGSGSKRTHHKARYPWTFRQEAAAIIVLVAMDFDPEDEAQTSLFSLLGEKT